MLKIIRWRYRVQLLLIGIISSSPAIAETYKWVDADGNTQYTQHRPPDGIVADTIKRPPKVETEAAKKQLEEQQKKLGEISKNRNEQKESELKQNEKTALKEENCKKARAKLANNQNTGRIRAVDEEGNVIRASEEERERRVNDAQGKVEKWCN